jgi:MFS family permease
VISRATAAKLALLLGLYFSQGLPFGFFTQALPVLLRERGVSLVEIGLSSLLAVPWGAKFLWAPAVDRYGARRAWILPLQAATALVLVGLGLAADEIARSLVPLLVATFACNLLAATQDIATDAWAVELLGGDERGIGNAVQVACYRVGMIVGGGALLVWIGTLGFAYAFYAMAALVLVSTVPALVARETPRARDSIEDDAPPILVKHFLRRDGAWRLLTITIVYKLGEALGVGMLRPFLKDVGLSLSDVGWLTGTVGFVAGLLGALAGGAAVNRIGRRAALVAFGLFQSLGTAAYAAAALWPSDRTLLVAAIATSHFATGTATVSLFTCMMDWSRKEAAATDYTVQASAVVIATGAASALSGLTAQLLGYPGHFAVAALLSLTGTTVSAALFRDPP